MRGYSPEMPRPVLQAGHRGPGSAKSRRARGRWAAEGGPGGPCFGVQRRHFPGEAHLCLHVQAPRTEAPGDGEAGGLGALCSESHADFRGSELTTGHAVWTQTGQNQREQGVWASRS